MIKKLAATASGLGSLFWLARPALAGDIFIPQPPEIKITELGGLLSAVISLILIVAALIFFFMLLIGGLQWIVSGGDKAATEGARGRITAALIGLVIVFAAWAVMRLVETFFGVTIISGPISFPTP